MKLVHLSDLHLGYGSGQGHGSGQGYGSGQRARDVLRAFKAAMARAAELAPDLVVVSGDVFDHPEVPAEPIAVFAKAVGRLRERLPGVEVVVVAGARDMPLDSGRPGPLALLGEVEQVQVASDSVRQVRLRPGTVNVVLAPHRAVADSRPLAVAPDPEADWNVLVAYAAVASGPAHASTVPLAGWDYIALGSNHTRTRVAERAHYAGSLERIGPDPWSEAAEDKGFMMFDGDSGEATFWPVKTRPAISLAPIDATGRGTATAARRLAEALAAVPGKIDGTLLRIPVKGLTPDDFAALDRKSLDPVRQRVAELRVLAAPDDLPRRPRSRPSPRPDDRVAAPTILSFEGDSPLRLRAPVPALANARGLTAFVEDGVPAWDKCVSILRDSLQSALELPGAHGGMLGQSTGIHPLRQEEWAALWLGDGPAATWVSAAVALASPVSAPPEIADTEAKETAPKFPPQPIQADEERLRSLREEEAEVRGDLEAGMVAWVRERQDAETRLLLYRDRGRELRARLKQIDAAGPDGSCRSCSAPLGDRLAAVAKAGREEWEGVVQDGRWWRRRLDQLQHKPAELKTLESRSLTLAAEAADLAEQLKRRERVGRAATQGAASPSRTAKDAPVEVSAKAIGEVRARAHAEVVEITGGRLAGCFPVLFDKWTAGAGRDSADVSSLEAAMRIAMAELALDAGCKLGSLVLPDSLGRLSDGDISRVLDRLARLARRIPLILVAAPERVVAAAPERFDLLFHLADSPDPNRERTVRRRRSGLGAVWLEP